MQEKGEALDPRKAPPPPLLLEACDSGPESIADRTVDYVVFVGFIFGGGRFMERLWWYNAPPYCTSTDSLSPSTLAPPPFQCLSAE